MFEWLELMTRNAFKITDRGTWLGGKGEKPCMKKGEGKLKEKVEKKHLSAKILFEEN